MFLYLDDFLLLLRSGYSETIRTFYPYFDIKRFGIQRTNTDSLLRCSFSMKHSPRIYSASIFISVMETVEVLNHAILKKKTNDWRMIPYHSPSSEMGSYFENQANLGLALHLNKNCMEF